MGRLSVYAMILLLCIFILKLRSPSGLEPWKLQLLEANFEPYVTA